jgi:tetrahydromethanopterin S-methyltransferase subunit F
LHGLWFLPELWLSYDGGHTMSFIAGFIIGFIVGVMTIIVLAALMVGD